MRLLSRLPRPIRHLSLYLFVFCSASAATAQTAHPAFEVATIRSAAPQADPNTGNWSPPGIGQFSATHVSLVLLLQLAYGVDGSQIVNKPNWLETNLYDIVAKPEAGISLTRDELRPRLQDLLQQRFHLVAHSETRFSRGYALVISKDGAHLPPTKADHFPGFRINVSPGQMRGANWSMPQLAKYLTSAAGFPVMDQTGLQGSYDIGFSYEPNPDVDSNLPSLNTALKEATGLFLKPQKVPIETLVIDSIDKTPTAN